MLYDISVGVRMFVRQESMEMIAIQNVVVKMEDHATQKLENAFVQQVGR